MTKKQNREKRLAGISRCGAAFAFSSALKPLSVDRMPKKSRNSYLAIGERSMRLSCDFRSSNIVAKFA